MGMGEPLSGVSRAFYIPFTTVKTCRPAPVLSGSVGVVRKRAVHASISSLAGALRSCGVRHACAPLSFSVSLCLPLPLLHHGALSP